MDLVVRIWFPIIGHILWESIVTVTPNSHLFTLEIEARCRDSLSAFTKYEKISFVLTLLDHFFEAVVKPVLLGV